MAFLRLPSQIILSLTLLFFITTANALSCPNSTDFIHKESRISKLLGWSWDLPASSGFELGENSIFLYFISPTDEVFPPNASLTVTLSSLTDMPDGKTTSAVLFCQYTLPDKSYYYVSYINKIAFDQTEKNRILQTWKMNSNPGIGFVHYLCVTTASLSSSCEINV